MPISERGYKDLLVLLSKYFSICHISFIPTVTALIYTIIVSHLNYLSSSC